MDLHVKFDGQEIIVTRPGTNMMTAYRNAPDRANLVLTRSCLEPTVSSQKIREFRAKAFQVAIAKAREVGWIVNSGGLAGLRGSCPRSSLRPHPTTLIPLMWCCMS